MNTSLEKPIPWRQRAFLNGPEVAAIFGRSTSWVHDRLTDGSLARARIRAGGSVEITVASVVALIDGALPVLEEPSGPPVVRRGKPQLVINNG